MIGHQREVLRTLGIDLWVPRAESCQNHTPSNVWRDQTAAEIIPDVQVNIPVQPIVPLEVKQETQPVVQKRTVSAAAQIVQPRALEDMQHIAAFQVQTLQLPHVLITVDVTEITAQQQQLWLNIQRAVGGQFSELQWPFAWAHVQDGRGAKSYIAGFIEAQSADRHVIYLGDIPHYQHEKAMQLASLQQMLEQPLLKRRLWQLMRNQPVS